MTRAVDELSPPQLISIYAASKVTAEQATHGYVRDHGADAVVVRLSWIYGPVRRAPINLETVLRAIIAGHEGRFDAGPCDMTH